MLFPGDGAYTESDVVLTYGLSGQDHVGEIGNVVVTHETLVGSEPPPDPRPLW